MRPAGAGLRSNVEGIAVNVVCEEIAVAVLALFFRKGIKKLVGLHGLSQVGGADTVFVFNRTYIVGGLQIVFADLGKLDLLAVLVEYADIQCQRLKLLDKNLEGFGNARRRDIVTLDDRFVPPNCALPPSGCCVTSEYGPVERAWILSSTRWWSLR